MAGIGVQFITAMNIQSGETQHLFWKNIPAQQVYSFSLDVRPMKYQIIVAPFVHQVEITRVEYRLNFPSIAGQEREIHWWIKNNGALEAIYELRMAIAFA